MTHSRRQFEVEHAGCASCAERLRDALSSVATVERIGIDEDADTAAVTISGETIEKQIVEHALARASRGSGHEYRVKSGSWR